MQLPLEPSPSLADQLASDPGGQGVPPLAFIDDEPFLLELQGSLDPPKGEDTDTTERFGGMSGVRVGKLDFENPKKPVLRIAHHRLEGKIEKLATPYALLRTRPKRDDPASPPDADSERPTKRPRTSPSASGPTSTTSLRSGPEGGNSDVPNKRIEIVALIRNKLVFSKRPEPLIDVSSEADPTFETRKRAALESNKGVKGPRGAAAAIAAAAAASASMAATGSTASAAVAGPATGKGVPTGGAGEEGAKAPALAGAKPAKAGLGKASSFFAPRKPAAAKPASEKS